MSYYPPSLIRLLRQQPIFLAIAVVVTGLMWGMGQSVNASTTLIYSFCLGNLTLLAMQLFGPLFEDRDFPYDWIIFVTLLFVLTPFTVTIATILVYWRNAPAGSPFWQYVSTSWKFPSLVTLVFGIIFNLYRSTKERLERRNLELQQAIALGNAERELQDRELERARDIQQALLPQTVAQIPGFEVAGVWEPARVVGGDYFDVIKLSDTKLAICIADVVGKSVSAALLMANVQATVRAFASGSISPAWLCTRVNGVLCNNIARDKFVTFFYGVLDSERRVLHYTNAGHLSPLLLRGSEALRLDDNGAVLGVFPEWKYEDATVQLAPNDRLLLFTDGITEAATPDGEEYGEGRLILAANAALRQSPAQLNSHLLADVKRFCNSQMSDDATLIVVKVQGAQTAHA